MCSCCWEISYVLHLNLKCTSWLAVGTRHNCVWHVSVNVKTSRYETWVCLTCVSVFSYCSSWCQWRDWSTHRKFCRRTCHRHHSDEFIDRWSVLLYTGWIIITRCRTSVFAATCTNVLVHVMCHVFVVYVIPLLRSQSSDICPICTLFL